jgi:hypothetical protein
MRRPGGKECDPSIRPMEAVNETSLEASVAKLPAEMT